MEFTTGTATRCTGGNHYTIPITVGGVTEDFTFTAEDLQELGEEVPIRSRVLVRLVSAVKESGATTLIQIRDAISSKTFKV